MKLKQLTIALEQVSVFNNPKVHLEQYPTSAEIASNLLYTACQHDDIEGKKVIDLGVGCGVLSCGALLMDAGHVLGLDIDPDAIKQASENAQELEVDLDLVNLDILGLLEYKHRFKADTVVMNPPFGTKNNKGIDIKFLQIACQIADSTVYSMHKTSTREYVLSKGRSFGFEANVFAELKYDIPQMYKFHKQKSLDIQVDVIKFSKI